MNATTPKVSVVLPVYNGERFLIEAIRSVLNQTYTNFEFIIVNDGSTDGSAQIIRSFRDGRILFIDNKENKKLPAALNAGLKTASGKYIARADADDINLPMRLERQVAFMENHTDIGVLGGAYILLSASRKNRIRKNPVRKFPKTHRECMRKLVQAPCFSHPAVMLRASALGAIRYDERFHRAQDYKLWTDLAKSGVRFANLAAPLVYYREHAGTVTETNMNIRKMADEKIQREYAEYILGGEITAEFADVLAWLHGWHDAQNTMQLPRLSVFYETIGANRFYFFKLITLAFRKRIARLVYRSGEHVHPKLLVYYRFYKCIAK